MYNNGIQVKIFLVIFCVITSSVTFGMDQQDKRVKVSSTRYLNEKFSNNPYLMDFAHNTGFAKRFGGKECSTEGLEFAIQTFVMNYQNENAKSGKSIEHLKALEKEVSAIVFNRV